MSRRPFPLRLEFPPELPISARAEEVTLALQRHPVLVLAGETGSGKSTQLPKLCLAAGRGAAGRIACTQPRRVAALSISRRVAEELGTTWGREVGCKIRFTDRTSPQTVIKFLTDGMLLAELQGDPSLREYDTIILDEAHERSLNIDFLLGHLRQLRFRRPELRLVITSATIDTEAFSRAFDDAPVIEVSGRTFPVEIVYCPLDEPGSDAAKTDPSAEAWERTEATGSVQAAKAEALHYVDGAVEAVERILGESPAGDILVFMPAERDIRETCDLLAGRQPARAEIIPLFGRLTNAEQQRVFASTQARKVVVATNIAETSLTIPGIRFVVDTGLARLSRYVTQSRTRRLPIEPISQSSADQRKGRCGRVADGVCVRLYSEQDYRDRPRFTQPEIQRCNLADVILRMQVFGLGDIGRFPFLNAPPARAVRTGYALLEELGAIEAKRDGAKAEKWESGRTENRESAVAEKRKNGKVGNQEAAKVETGATGGAEAGAGWELTSIGRELAHLPVDPTVGRMILQARAEKCLREVVVIAAGLSIQDPRERPLDRQADADAAHRRFAHPDSDFLTLLTVWDAMHGEFERLTPSRLRRFCLEHFLSYTRVREWRDIHDQLVEVLSDRDDFKLTSVWDGWVAEAGARLSRRANPRRLQHDPPTEKATLDPEPGTQNSKPGASNSGLAFGTPGYRAIHRSILAGLLGNIAVRDEQTGRYRAVHDRQVTIFPGSTLYAKPEAGTGGRTGAKRRAAVGRRTPRWIVASEIVETARLYARTVAVLDPAWALDLGAHLLKVSHAEPYWNAEAGRVLVRRRTRLYGLELDVRSVGFGRIDPQRATEIFIREGLVGDTVIWPFEFLAHNRRARAAVEALLTRTRSRGYLSLDERFYGFYAERLLPDEGGAGVSSVPELVDLVRGRQAADPKFLQFKPEDLLEPSGTAPDASAFPETLPLENRVLPLDYAYRPGQEDDGVTLTVSARDAAGLTPEALDWAVPGHLEAKVLNLLKALPTSQRRALIPLAATARKAAAAAAQTARLRGGRIALTEVLAALLRETHRLAVDPGVWTDRPLPDHLRVRVRVMDENGRLLAAGRDLPAVLRNLEVRQRRLGAAGAREETAAWRRARERWETGAATTWIYGDVRERVAVGEEAGVPVFAHAALVPMEAGVALRLLPDPEQATAVTRRGLARLFELQLRYELAWLQRDLRTLRTVGLAAATFVPAAPLPEQAYASVRRWLCERPVAPLTAAAFSRELDRARADARGLAPRLADRLREIFARRQTLLACPEPYPELTAELEVLLPPDFVETTPYPQLAHLPRYLQAMELRAGRWRRNPSRDRERAALLEPYVRAVAALRREQPASAEVERIRWLVEEYRVSLFAQELKTAGPVSGVKLDRALAALRRPASTAPARPPRPAPVIQPAKGPLKTLGGLDRLFPR